MCRRWCWGAWITECMSWALRRARDWRIGYEVADIVVRPLVLNLKSFSHSLPLRSIPATPHCETPPPTDAPLAAV